MANDIQSTSEENQIVLYKPNDSISLEVKIDAAHETVWLTRQQMATLFGRDVKTIGKHINNALREELAVTVQANNAQTDSVVANNAITAPTVAKSAIVESGNPTVAKFAIVQNEGGRMVEREVEHYSLDMILSVGYRVHSPQGIAFRQWANSVLRQYLFRGYAMHQQMLQMEERIDRKLLLQHDEMQQIRDVQTKQQQQLDFFIRTSTPPAEMVFFNGEFFTARVALENIIKTARTRAIIIDGYIDANTFDILGTRAPGVLGQIYTVGVGSGITRLRDEHNRQPGVEPIEVFKWRNESHDRWLIIDNQLWHCGHSLNALGSKMSAITLMGKSPDDVLAEVQ